MGRKRWGKPRATPQRRKPGAGSPRYVRREIIDVYRDPKTGLLMKIGPDHGPEERQQHQLGVVTGKRLAFNDEGRPTFTEGARAIAPSVLDALNVGGFLHVTPAPRPFCPRSKPVALRLTARRFGAAEDFAALCRRAGVVRRITAGYEFRTDRGQVGENKKALEARRKLKARALRLGTDRFNVLVDVLLLDIAPDDRALVAFLRALDAYADLLQLARAEGI